MRHKKIYTPNKIETLRCIMGSPTCFYIHSKAELIPVCSVIKYIDIYNMTVGSN